MRASDTGVVVDDVEITDGRGWLELPCYTATGGRRVHVRVRVAPDARGAPFIYADEVRVDDRTFASVHSLATAEGGGWVVFLAHAIPREFARRTGATVLARRHVSETRAVESVRPRASEDTLPPPRTVAPGETRGARR